MHVFGESVTNGFLPYVCNQQLAIAIQIVYSHQKLLLEPY